MAITKFKNIAQSDLDRAVWRYLPFSKYISLLAYGALWFSKLNILQDKYEGTMPSRTDAAMRVEHERFKRHIHPSMHHQIDEANVRNVADGRELTTVSCWFSGEAEDERMWREYGKGNEGVAIKSTIRSLSENVHCDPQISQMGQVQYVDLETHTISSYEASQAQERALLKSAAYKHEKEVRILTMSLRGPMCVGMDGKRLREEEWIGAGMNNFENPGLYILADLRKLIHKTVLAPGADPWFESMVKHLAEQGDMGPVERSALD